MIASVSVGTTQTTVLSPTSGSPYKFVAVGNNGTTTVYLNFTGGTTSVTSSNGIPLPGGAAFICDQQKERELFDAGVKAITASGTTTLSVQSF